MVIFHDDSHATLKNTLIILSLKFVLDKSNVLIWIFFGWMTVILFYFIDSLQFFILNGPKSVLFFRIAIAKRLLRWLSVILSGLKYHILYQNSF